MGLYNRYRKNKNTEGTLANKISNGLKRLATPEGGKSYGPTGLKYPGTPGPTVKREAPKPSTPKSKPKASKPVPKRQTVDLGPKLESKGPGTLDSGIGSASIKRVTREAPAPKLTAKDIKKNAKNQIKGIKAVAKAERKDMKLADKKAKSDARNAAVAKRTSERNAAQAARAAGKAALKEAKTASRAQRITDKYNKKISKLKGANIAAKGGPVKKKQLPDGVKTLPNIVSKDSVGTKKIPKWENLPYKPQNDSIPKWEKLPYKPSNGDKKTKPLGSSKKFKCGGKMKKK